MTPKEKAKELFNIYWDLLLIHNVSHRKLFTKQCALIAVDEIRSCIKWNHYPLDKEWRFWQEVKQEIEKL
jgi:hypothetical protein